MYETNDLSLGSYFKHRQHGVFAFHKIRLSFHRGLLGKMYKLVFVLSQYVALCGAFTSPNPNTVGWQVGTDPLFGGSFWGNQMNFDPFFPPTNLPFNEAVPSTPPTNPPKNQTTTESPKAPTTAVSYDTATPSVQTAPPTVPPTSTNQKTEASISLQELIRLAARNSNSNSESITSKIFLKMMGPVSNTNNQTSVANLNAESTEIKSKPSQTIVSTAPSADTQNVSTTTTETSPSPTSTSAPTTTPRPTTTTESTTTTTTTKATTTTTTPAPTTTTTTTTITPPTAKPLVKMTLAEILKLSKFKLPVNTQTTTTTTTPKPKGCHYKGHFYAPLEEIERGQTGNWCYGSYCNHEGIVIHWDDHKCSASPSTPPTAKKPKSDSALDVGTVAGALTQSEIDALATVPGMKGIAETLRQYSKQSTTESPSIVNAAMPPVRMPPIGMANGMGGMNMDVGMNGVGGAGMGSPSMIELAKMAGIDIGGAGGTSSMGEMGGMSGMGGAAGANMAELAAMAGIELPGGSGGASGMGGMGGLGGAGGGNIAELAAMAGIELPSGSGGASGMGGMGGLGGAGGGSMAELAAIAGIELPSGSGGVGAASMSGMGGGGGGSMAELAGMEGMSGMGAGMGGMGAGMGGMGAGIGGRGMGCFVNGRHYAPGTDIENHRDYGRCFGSYCDFNSKVVHWNDRCRAMPPMSPPSQTMSMRQLQQLDLI